MTTRPLWLRPHRNRTIRRVAPAVVMLAMLLALFTLPVQAGGHANGLSRWQSGDHATAGPMPGDGPQADPIADLVAAVDEDRWFADVETLAAFGTRRSLTAGNLAARDWLQVELESLGLPVEIDPFSLSGQTSYNVVAELRGRTRPQQIVIVGAHFDSTSPQASTNAPGAEDNASGTAAVLEMARILADRPPQATIRFIAFGGEEQGLVGSSHYAASMTPDELANTQGVIIMDMIGYTGDAELDVLLETYAWAEPLRARLRTAAGQWTSLVTYDSNNPFGSDHMPFLNRNLQTVLLIQNEWAGYPCYHATCDLPALLSRPQGREMMKMLVATLGGLAGSCRLADADCDGRVTVADVQAVAAHWNSNATQPGFDHRRDLDHDGDVDVDDIALAAQDWGWIDEG